MIRFLFCRSENKRWKHTRLKKYSVMSGRKWSSSFLLYVSWIAGSFHTSSTKGAYSRVAAGKNASKSPVAMISNSQSEKCFNLGLIEYMPCPLSLDSASEFLSENTSTMHHSRSYWTSLFCTVDSKKSHNVTTNKNSRKYILKKLSDPPFIKLKRTFSGGRNALSRDLHQRHK